MKKEYERIWRWLRGNGGIILDKDCSCCKYNQEKFHKFIEYLKKISKEEALK